MLEKCAKCDAYEECNRLEWLKPILGCTEDTKAVDISSRQSLQSMYKDCMEEMP